jgi:hypothetical protein
MFIVSSQQYDLVERALDRDDRYVRDDDLTENIFMFREGVGGRIVAVKFLGAPLADSFRGDRHTSYYAAGRVLPLAIDLMIEEEGLLDDDA